MGGVGRDVTRYVLLDLKTGDNSVLARSLLYNTGAVVLARHQRTHEGHVPLPSGHVLTSAFAYPANTCAIVTIIRQDPDVAKQKQSARQTAALIQSRGK